MRGVCYQTRRRSGKKFATSKSSGKSQQEYTRKQTSHDHEESRLVQHSCYHCGRNIVPLERVGRRDACLHCGADLHCCLNCRFHEPSSENQCRESQAERQVDKTVGNFCDYFAFREGAAQVAADTGVTARAKLSALFERKKS